MNKEFFINCELFQGDANAGLRNYTDQTRSRIINELVTRHRNFNISICGEFEAIEKRALNIPEETAELLELGRYMTQLQSVLLPQLMERLAESLQMLISLFELTVLSKDHLELNRETINWTQNIKPVLEKHSMLFEGKKFELEERLQGRVMNLNASIEHMYPK